MKKKTKKYFITLKWMLSHRELFTASAVEEKKKQFSDPPTACMCTKQKQYCFIIKFAFYIVAVFMKHIEEELQINHSLEKYIKSKISLIVFYCDMTLIEMHVKNKIKNEKLNLFWQLMETKSKANPTGEIAFPVKMLIPQFVELFPLPSGTLSIFLPLSYLSVICFCSFQILKLLS